MALSLAEAEQAFGAVGGASVPGATATTHPRDIFLDALRTAVVGEDDVNMDDSDDDDIQLMGAVGVRDVRLTAVNRTLTSMGIGPMVRRTIDRLLQTATSTGSAEVRMERETDSRNDAVTFRSLADVESVMRNLGKSAAETETILRALRALPSPF